MSDHEDYDDFTESQGAELSGPVGTTRTRARRVAQPCPAVEFTSAAVRHQTYLRPHRTGPPN